MQGRSAPFNCSKLSFAPKDRKAIFSVASLMPNKETPAWLICDNSRSFCNE